jgi:hypothetical protein
VIFVPADVLQTAKPGGGHCQQSFATRIGVRGVREQFEHALFLDGHRSILFAKLLTDRAIHRLGNL